MNVSKQSGEIWKSGDIFSNLEDISSVRGESGWHGHTLVCALERLSVAGDWDVIYKFLLLYLASLG